jgi:hypothetical protein
MRTDVMAGLFELNLLIDMSHFNSNILLYFIIFHNTIYMIYVCVL